MQNRYVGDIGDFAKYGLLRALSPQKRLGVAWYLYPDESQNADGKHIAYLRDPEQWKHLDPSLFEGLKRLISGGHRSVAAVEKSGLLPKRTVFANEVLETQSGSYALREHWRREWFTRLRKNLAPCSLVFVGPDNGLFPDDSFRYGTRKHWKKLPLKEALTLAEGCPAILYHHNSRHRGPHRQEIQYWQEQICDPSYAFHWRRVSNRTFFIVNPDRSIIKRLTKFAEEWREHGDLIPPV